MALRKVSFFDHLGRTLESVEEEPGKSPIEIEGIAQTPLKEDK
ncbi:MAG TPA: hypothetical protein VGI29_04025 [Candidatus Binataceae bacterium]